MSEEVFEKCGIVTISVYKNSNKDTCFIIDKDSDNVVDISEIVEDTLSLY